MEDMEQSQWEMSQTRHREGVPQLSEDASSEQVRPLPWRLGLPSARWSSRPVSCFDGKMALDSGQMCRILRWVVVSVLCWLEGISAFERFCFGSF